MKALYILIGLMIFQCEVTFCQTISKSEAIYCISEQCDKMGDIHTCRYTILNNNTSRIIIFFTEDENTSCPFLQLLKRKLCRHYKDFSLSMLVWEANMSIEGYTLVPELFVKTLNQGESFDIIIELDSLQSESAVDLQKHLLICTEDDLSKIHFPKFVYHLNAYKFEYSYPYILIHESSFRRFISKYQQYNNR